MATKEQVIAWYERTFNKTIPVDLDLFIEKWGQDWVLFFCEAIVQSRYFNSSYVTAKNVFGVSDSVGDQGFKLKNYRSWKIAFAEVDKIYKKQKITNTAMKYLAAILTYKDSDKVIVVPRADGTYADKHKPVTVDKEDSSKNLNAVLFWLRMISRVLLPLSLLSPKLKSLRVFIGMIVTLLEQYIASIKEKK